MSLLIKARVILTLLCLTVLFLSSSCRSTVADYSGFVRTVNFSQMQTFRYKHTLAAGLDWQDAQRIVLEDLTPKVIGQEFSMRGFEPVEAGADILVVVKWRKAVSVYQDPMDSIDGPIASLSRRDTGTSFAPRISLIVELYSGPEEKLFWRKELHNAFDAIQFTTDRINRTLVEALKNFPNRIEQDDSLPMIE